MKQSNEKIVILFVTWLGVVLFTIAVNLSYDNNPYYIISQAAAPRYICSLQA